ncbi:hypothetical protein AgCh_013353 [Apium graveolens]
MAIKKNRRVVLIQECEHFEAKPNESLTDIYDRFLTLLNNLSLVGKYDLEVITLDEVYGMLKTHDFEVRQRRQRKSNKGKSVALKVNDKALRKKSAGAARKKNNLPESDTDDSSSNPDDDTDSETDENMTDSNVMQIAALLVRGFRMMQFRKSKNHRSFRKKLTGSERKSTGRKDGKDSRAGKVDRTKIKCYNCDEPGHFATEGKKTKHDKGKSKALIKSSKNWEDSSDSDDEDTCYALMASLDDPVASKPKNKTLETDRLKTKIEILKSRNEQLESDLINQIELKKECDRAKHSVKILEARYSILEKDLETKRKTLKAWIVSGKKKLMNPNPLLKRVQHQYHKKNW